MVQPNAPRFMREGDNIEFSAKIVNLGDKEMTGQVSFELIDAASNTSVDGWFQNVFPSQYFTVEAGQSFRVKFPMQVPYVLTGAFGVSLAKPANSAMEKKTFYLFLPTGYWLQKACPCFFKQIPHR